MVGKDTENFNIKHGKSKITVKYHPYVITIIKSNYMKVKLKCSKLQYRFEWLDTISHHFI